MYGKRIKAGAFVLEGLNSMTATFHFYFIFWFLKAEFGFGSRENLVWAIGHGLVYVVASVYGGRYGQRRGYLRALRLGFAGMLAAFVAGWVLNGAGLSRGAEIAGQVLVMVVATVSICFTWPNLEALVSEGEPGHRLQRYIGIYNLVWSGAGSAAFFGGGAMIEALGERTVIFLIPGVLVAVQLGLLLVLAPGGGVAAGAGGGGGSTHGWLASEGERRRSRVDPKVFLRMSWMANPCAYLAISTAIPLIPTLAERLGLDARMAGFFCSVWLFVRTATFVGLWQWSGWHYRFRWLAGAFVGMIAGFLCIFLGAAMEGLGRGAALGVVLGAQVVFGVCIGLIYYSSLYYSMDVGDTKGDHGGIHEAAIGAGILGGPLVGGVAQWIRPGSTSVAAWAVSGVLLIGFGVLWRLWRRGSRSGGSG
jgi:hypothetical protein